mgnify:CR=1 FL=1
MAQDKIVISGIQQAGIGVPDVHEAWAWYRKNFGTDIRVFEEKAVAQLMLPYTGGKPRSRHAALAINLQGGGGFEIWQYTERTPQPPLFTPEMGDLGIYIVKIKSFDISSAHQLLQKNGVTISGIENSPGNEKFFFAKDLYGNPFQVVETKEPKFRDEEKPTGSVYGAVLGVTDIAASAKFYAEILGYDKIVYDEEGKFDDISWIEGGNGNFRRMLLTHTKPRKGAFSKMFGSSQLELVQKLDGKPRKIFENRMWGDLGFIHLCFDIYGMDAMRDLCASKGHPFTIDSFKGQGERFDMGEAAGHFSYIEDPDGTLIEFVETHKVPLVKKIGWYLNMSKRNPEKPLPDWMLKAMRFSRVK